MVRTWSEWDWEGADTAFRQTIELNSNYPDARAYYSHYLNIMKRPAEAMAQIERALELDPLNSLFQALYAVDLLVVGRYDDAIAQCREVRRTAPRAPLIHTALHNAFYMKLMYAEAFEEMRSWYAAKGDREVEEALVRGYAEAGYPRAMNLAAEALAARSAKTFVRSGTIAKMYLFAGKENKALDWLEKAYETRDPNLPYVRVVPIFDSVRSDPRFQDLLRRMNFPE